MPAQATEAAAEAVRTAIAKINSKEQDSNQQDGEDKDSSADKDADDSKPTVEAGLVDPKKDITVFSSQTNFNVKHPLYSPWTMWFDSASKQVSSDQLACLQTRY